MPTAFAAAARRPVVWAGVTAAMFAVTLLQLGLPVVSPPACVTAAAFGVPMLAGLLLGRWGWVTVIGGGLAAWAVVPPPTGGLAALAGATAAAAVAGWWPTLAGLGPLTRPPAVTGLAAGVAAVALTRGLVTGLTAAALGLPDPVAAAGMATAVKWLVGLLVAGPLFAGRFRPRAEWGVLVAGCGVLLAVWLHPRVSAGQAFTPILSALLTLGLVGLAFRTYAGGVAWANLALAGVVVVAILGVGDPWLPAWPAGGLLALAVGGFAVLLLWLGAVAWERQEEACGRAGLAADLDRQREWLATVLRRLPVGVTIIDPDGRPLLRNDKHDELFATVLGPPAGWTGGRLAAVADLPVRRPDGTAVAFDQWPIVRAARERVPAREPELHIRRPDGTDLVLAVEAVPVPGLDGRPGGAAAVVSDLTDLRRAERRLREQNERTHFALTAARMIAWEWDPATDRVTRSGSLHDWLGLPPDVSLDTGSASGAYIHPDDRAWMTTHLSAEALNGRTARFEFRMTRADGGTLWIECHAQTDPPGPDGRPGRLYGVNLDVSARKRGEERLRMLESVAVYARDAVVILDGDPRPAAGRPVRYVNEAFGRMTGYDPAEVVGKSLHLLRGPGSDPATLDRLRAALDAGTPLQAELLNYRKDGSAVWVELSLVPVPTPDAPYGRPGHWVMIQRDVSDRKRAEAELAEREAQFRALAEAMPDALYVLDPDDPVEPLVIRYANPAAAAMTGYTVAELVGRSLVRLLDTPVTAAAAPPRVARVLAGQPVTFEGTHRHRDGRMIPVEVRAGLIRWQGKTAVLGIDRDITDRRWAEEALRQSEERLRLALRAAGAIAFVWDPQADTVTRYFSLEPSLPENVGRPETVADVAARIHPDDRADFRSGVEACLAAGPEYHNLYRVVRPDGSVGWLEEWGLLSRDDDGRPARLTGVSVDVTDCKRAEAALRASEERYRLLFDANPQPMWLVDQETMRFLAVNEAAVRAYGYTRDEFLGMTIGDIRPPDDVSPRPAPHRLGEMGYHPTTVWRHRTKAGAVIEVEVTTYGLTLDGRPVEIVLAVDVTERRRLEEQLRQAQKMEAVGQLAGGIAHDFNNLLTGVLGNLALARLPADHPAAGPLAAAQTAAQRAADLTGKLLGFARRSPLLLAPVRADELAAEAVALARPSVPSAVAVALDLPPTPPVPGDPTLLTQAVLNLLLNARDAMPDGGTLTVAAAETDVTPDHPGKPPAAPPGRYVRLTVADTGEGIAPAVRGRIFEPFFTTKGPGKGTGLGLPMVLGIVEQHGGWVAVESAVGAGSRFDLYLPRADVTALTPSPRGSAVAPDRPGPPPSPGRLVLLVDDEAMIRDLGRAVLQSAGYRVLEAADGAEAVATYRDRHADIALVVLDMTMPHMGGVEAFTQIRAIDPTVRVIFSTGYTPDNLPAATGDAELLPKPYRPDEFLAIVRRLLGEPSASG